MILETVGLRKSFGGVTAVDKVDLTVNERDTHAIIGPNGAGKTTFFNLVTKYLEPDEGKVIFDGQEITQMTPELICRKGLVRSFQRASIYSRLTVYESIQMSLLSQDGKTLNFLRPMKKMAKEETEEILERVGLTEQAGILGSSLSQGDRKRLELAIILGNRPKLLLLDEPTAGMSREETRSIMELISSMSERHGLTVLFSEHDMSVVFGIAKRITVMHLGAIIADGKPEEVRKNTQVQKIYLGEE
jgi:branched-chain amino acid transport system ATP-binding protein